MKPLRRDPRAIALIVTLVTLVIATILIVAFVTTMRTERRAANAVANDERSKLIAQSALQHAMAVLSKNIPQPVPLGYVSGVTSPVTGITATGSAPVNWIVNPGLLTLYTGPDGSTPQYVPLFTSTNASTSPSTVPTGDVVNLNAPLLSNPGAYPIIPTGDPVPAGWIYVTQDPTAVASATNPIIGRYAFWMDDENNKININTAYGKPPSLQNTIVGDSNNYMVRSNPLDSSTNNGYLWYPATSANGISVFQPEVGFNSLAGTPIATSTTGGNVDIYPGDTTDGYPASSKEANAVGNPKTTGSFPGPRYYPIWHPSAVNLDILPTNLTNSAGIGVTDTVLPTTSGTALNRMSLADWVFNSCLTSGVPSTLQNTARWRLFQSPDQIEQFITTGTAAAAAFYQANEFNLTAYNRAPEFNVFGKPRLFMESRINSTEDSTAAKYVDTSSGNLSGSELEFCQTPDLDPMGPTYFHGYENMTPYTGSSSYYPDLNSVQMVADYLSTLFARSDWPGMPANESFVSKWGGNANSTSPTDDIGRREADQVAWNIVAMGNYASNLEGMSPNSPLSWPDDEYNTFKRNAGAADPDSGNNVNPNRSRLTNQLTTAAGTDPNLSLRVGKLSGKAIMPYSPKPYVNEISLQVNAVPVSPSTSPGIYYLQLGLQVELYIPRRGPPGSFWNHLNYIYFVPTHFFYTATGTNDKGTVVTCIQGATGAPSYGNGGTSETYIGSGGTGTLVYYPATFKGRNSGASGGSTTFPWAGCLGGKFLLSGTGSNTYVPVDSYQVVASSSGAAIYTSTSTSMLYVSGTSVPAGAQKFQGIVNIQAKLRLALYDNGTDNTWEIVPIWDTVDTSVSALSPPASQNNQDSVSWNFNIDLNNALGMSTANGGTFYRSLEATDSRLGGNTLDQNGNPIWHQVTSGTMDAETLVDASLGAENGASKNSTPPLDLDSFGYFDFQGGGSGGGFYKNSPRPSIGFLDCVPTGMQRGIMNSTLTFGPSGSKARLPDWLMLDLVAPTFADINQPTPAPYSYLHSTMGKININSAIYPALTTTADNPTARPLPLEALFENTVPSSALPTLAANIAKGTLSTGSSAGQAFGALNTQYPQYNYIGELCEIAGVADGTNTPGGANGTKWQREALIRNLANLITTQSNTFHVWGAAQAVKVVKGSGNTNYGIYQPGDALSVMGEKRFESVIERSVWPGVDGVPGNGHITSGVYDQKSTDTVSPVPVSLPWAAVSMSGAAAASAVSPNSAVWAQLDGPLPSSCSSPGAARTSAGYPPNPGWYGLQYNSTSLQNAQNPAQIIMTYKPIMFRYISE